MFAENANIFKKSIKKILKTASEDVWKSNHKKVREEYSNPGRVQQAFGSYFYDAYVGPYYYVHEQQRLQNIVRSKMAANIVSGRSAMYESRTLGDSQALIGGKTRPRVRGEN